MARTATIEDVLKNIDRKELTEIALTLGNIPSPTGHEKDVAEFILGWLQKNGFKTIRQDAAPNRPNVIGVLKGKGNGQSLILNAHIDTAFGNPGEDQWVLEDMRATFYKAWLDGDTIYGQGVVNDKGPLSACMIAAKTLKESGVQLEGDLIVTGVVGEIGGAPIDEFQGPAYFGKGLGTRQLVLNGIVADHALVAEGTNFAPTWVEAGDVWFKITVHGLGGIYTPFIERPKALEDNPSAIVRMSQIVLALEEWARRYEQDNKYEFANGTVVPKVNFGAIRAGLPYRITKTAGVCSIYVDVRLPPGEGYSKVKEEIQRVIETTRIKAQVETYLYRRGYEGKGIETLFNAVKKAHRYLFNEEPRRVDSGNTSMWRDLNVFNEVGIPSLTYGPSQGIGGGKHFIHTNDLYNAARAYTLIAYDICGREKNPVK